MEQRIGHYRIVDELGRGGMGVVYKAHEESLNRFVALKVLGEHLTRDEEYLKRFLLEAQSAAQLNHPNIVQIYFIGEEDGRHYFAMEYVSGTGLDEVIRSQGPLEGPRAAQMILQAAAGLAGAHDQGVIHRDIKPANLILSDAGLIKIADFGLAYMPEVATRLTAENVLMGSPRYMSPEQCLGDPIDHRTDIYSLGVTFYEMLTGRLPFRAENPLALMREIIEVEPVPTHEVRSEVDPRIWNILQRMLAKKPTDRIDDAHRLTNDLHGYLVTHVIPGWEQIGTGSGSSPRAIAMPAAVPPADGASPTPAAEAPTGSDSALFAAPRRRRTVALVLAIALALALAATAAWRLSSVDESAFERLATEQAEGEQAPLEESGAPTGDDGSTTPGADLENDPPQPLKPVADEADAVAASEPMVATPSPGGAAATRSAAPISSPAPAPLPRPSAPPARATATTTAVIATGERLLAAEVEAYLERRLMANGIELLDERLHADLWPLAESASLLSPHEATSALQGRAGTLVLALVEYLGERPLTYMGQRDVAFQSRVTVYCYDVVSGRPLMPSWSEVVEYTRIEVGRSAELALQRRVFDLLQRLGS